MLELISTIILLYVLDVSGPVDGHNCFIGKNHPSTTASPKQWILTSSSTDGKCHCTNFLLGGINLMASQNVLYVLANLDNLSSLGNIQEDCKAKGISNSTPTPLKISVTSTQQSKDATLSDTIDSQPSSKGTTTLQTEVDTTIGAIHPRLSEGAITKATTTTARRLDGDRTTRTIPAKLDEDRSTRPITSQQGGDRTPVTTTPQPDAERTTKTTTPQQPSAKRTARTTAPHPDADRTTLAITPQLGPQTTVTIDSATIDQTVSTLKDGGTTSCSTPESTPLPSNDEFDAPSTSCPTLQAHQSFENCLAVYSAGYNTSGVYMISLSGVHYRMYCDMSLEGGWMVIQRRLDGSTDFYRNWYNYTNGFGNLCKEFYWGNENLKSLLPSSWTLRVELGSFDGSHTYREYDGFRIDRVNFHVQVTGVGTGNAGDGLSAINNNKFVTYDANNDNDAANEYHSGWWFGKDKLDDESSPSSNLNGRYYLPNDTRQAWHGIVWVADESLKKSQMKIRPNVEKEDTLDDEDD